MRLKRQFLHSGQELTYFNSKYEEMRKEIESLRTQLADQTAKNRAMSASLQQGDLVYPSPGSNTTLTPQRIEDVAISGDRLASLFHQFVCLEM